MPRRLPEEMKAEKLAALCVATRFEDAGAVEAALDSASIDYTFEIQDVARSSVLGILFGSDRKGVVFLVPEEKLEFCLGLLHDAGLTHLGIDS